MSGIPWAASRQGRSSWSEQVRVDTRRGGGSVQAEEQKMERAWLWEVRHVRSAGAEAVCSGVIRMERGLECGAARGGS